MATHSSILTWRIPWTEELGSQRVGHDRATEHSRSKVPKEAFELQSLSVHLEADRRVYSFGKPRSCDGRFRAVAEKNVGFYTKRICADVNFEHFPSCQTAGNVGGQKGPRKGTIF